MNRHVDTFMVRVGSSTYNNGGVAHSIAKTIIHPAFNASDRSYDISTVQTMDEIVFNSYTKPIALATTNKESGLAYVTGWGIVGVSSLINIVKEFLIYSICSNITRHYHWPSMHCICNFSQQLLLTTWSASSCTKLMVLKNVFMTITFARRTSNEREFVPVTMVVLWLLAMSWSESRHGQLPVRLANLMYIYVCSPS